MFRNKMAGSSTWWPSDDRLITKLGSALEVCSSPGGSTCPVGGVGCLPAVNTICFRCFPKFENGQKIEDIRNFYLDLLIDSMNNNDVTLTYVRFVLGWCWNAIVMEPGSIWEWRFRRWTDKTVGARTTFRSDENVKRERETTKTWPVVVSGRTASVGKVEMHVLQSAWQWCEGSVGLVVSLRWGARCTHLPIASKTYTRRTIFTPRHVNNHYLCERSFPVTHFIFLWTFSLSSPILVG
jgi:hypothetical protein